MRGKKENIPWAPHYAYSYVAHIIFSPAPGSHVPFGLALGSQTGLLENKVIQLATGDIKY